MSSSFGGGGDECSCSVRGVVLVARCSEGSDVFVFSFLEMNAFRILLCIPPRVLTYTQRPSRDASLTPHCQSAYLLITASGVLDKELRCRG